MKIQVQIGAPDATGAALLEAERLASDLLQVRTSGILAIDGHSVDELLAQFGSPLNVLVAETARVNYRRIRDAFSAAWSAEIEILYSTKANSTLALRSILSAEGAGGDCFGLGELHATLQAGTDPARVALNGSDKSAAEIEAGVAAGVVVNVDGIEEAAFLRAACTGGRTARVNLRLKVLPAALDTIVEASRQPPGGFVEGVRRVKWGFLPEQAAAVLRSLQAVPGVEVVGCTGHIGHLSDRPEAFAAVAAALGDAVGQLRAATGFVPRLLDLGGGWAPERDPSTRRPGRNGPPIETVAHAACAALRAALPADMPVPKLWIEPGRYIASNAVVLLARVGAVKRDGGLCWAHVDASTNNLPRIESGQFHYRILPASRMHDPADEPVEVVGGTCFRSLLGGGRRLPAPRRGDIMAVLDAGSYAEVFATQFNSVPRPATVMVSSHGAEIVRMRETEEDVFRMQRVPAWLRAGAA